MISDKVAMRLLHLCNWRGLHRARRMWRTETPRNALWFEDKRGFAPDLTTPRRFGEKVIWRMMYDRNPLFPVLVDKFAARGYVDEKLGAGQAEKLMAPLLWVGTNPRKIPFDRFNAPVVIKPSHGSGWVENWDPSDDSNRRKVRASCRRWLRTIFGLKAPEWAYINVRPRIIVERHLTDGDRSRLLESKMFVIGGQIATVRLQETHTVQRAHYDRDFTRRYVKYISTQDQVREQRADMDKPAYWDEMCEIACRLADGLDMLRVDFLHDRDRFWLGELTVYPSAGQGWWEPEEFDLELADLWILPPKAG